MPAATSFREELFIAGKKRILPYVINVIIILIVVILVARILQPLSYSSQAFIQVGLFYDKICYRGSYEMIVCPYTAPPYEVFMGILAILLITSLWTGYRKKQHGESGREGRV